MRIEVMGRKQRINYNNEQDDYILLYRRVTTKGDYLLEDKREICLRIQTGREVGVFRISHPPLP